MHMNMTLDFAFSSSVGTNIAGTQGHANEKSTKIIIILFIHSNKGLKWIHLLALSSCSTLPPPFTCTHSLLHHPLNRGSVWRRFGEKSRLKSLGFALNGHKREVKVAFDFVGVTFDFDLFAVSRFTDCLPHDKTPILRRDWSPKAA